jgi:hypothetical protein
MRIKLQCIPELANIGQSVAVQGFAAWRKKSRRAWPPSPAV